MLHIAGSLPAMRKSNTKVQKKMHICKSPRRKIARKCIFCAGVPAYARIRAGATALKSNSASYNFSAEWGPRQNLHMQCFGGEKRRQASLLCRHAASVATALPHAQPGIALQYLRREPARREGACRSTKDATQKKSSRVSRLDCLSQNFCHELFPNYALPVTTKPADAYTCYYVEHQGYTDVQGYAVEPRDVTFGWKLHKHLFVLIDGVGGCNCSIAP